MIADQLGLKARGEKPGLLGRSSAALRSEIDWQGGAPLRTGGGAGGSTGASDAMVTLDRQPGAGYSVTTGLVALQKVAGIERRFPVEWIGGDGCSIVPAFAEWAAPLVGPLDRGAWLA